MDPFPWKDQKPRTEEVKDNVAQTINLTLFGATDFATKWYLCMARTHRQIEVQALETYVIKQMYVNAYTKDKIRTWDKAPESYESMSQFVSTLTFAIAVGVKSSLSMYGWIFWIFASGILS